MIKVNVLFFGATADRVGKRKIELSLEGGSSARAVFERILEEHPGLKGHRLLFSVNQEYADGERPVGDGDELAVFTAVSGG